MDLSDSILITMVAAAWMVGVVVLGLTAARTSRGDRRRARVLAGYERMRSDRR